MKRIITLLAVAAASLVLASKAHAQLGVIAGLTSSKVNASEAVGDVKNIALYHAGLTYKLDLGAGFAFQPSVIYQVKGANLSNIKDTTNDQLKTGYVELPMGIQWAACSSCFTLSVISCTVSGTMPRDLKKCRRSWISSGRTPH